MEKKKIVVFDFDGTLSSGDSNTDFYWHCFWRSPRGMLYLPLTLACAVVARFCPRGVWWRENIRRCITTEMVKKFAPEFIKIHRARRFGWAADQVAAERAAGNIVLCISAGPDYLIPKLVRDMRFDAVLCSKMDKKKPWRFRFLCHDARKVWALYEWCDAREIMPVVARSYSDSRNDLPMMEIAGDQVWIDKKTGLRRMPPIC
ncbi:MAG: haloacid dehalogenase-like hydrolase [Rickettsiales bacterium]|jgi:phosphoserine phosphatase|nr:haloacid dehalogenase-like hydrolase [Rickettsiales bacterium]